MKNSSVVLQRGVPVVVWGTATPAAKEVTLTLSGTDIATAKVASDGRWETHLPAQKAAHMLILRASAGSASISTTVSFGEVIVCAGQSNMGMQVGPSARKFDADNATAEAAAAGRYTNKIYFFAMGGGRDTDVNASDWYTVTPITITTWSAVCWYTGRDLFDHINTVEDSLVPVGMMLSAIGAHPIESWLTQANTDKCGVKACTFDGASQPTGKIWSNVLPYLPYTPGVMLWDQGERDIKCSHTTQYPCLEQQLKAQWRLAFDNTSFPFIAVQLPGYDLDRRISPMPEPRNPFNMRLAQEAGVASDSLAAVTATYDDSCAFNLTNGCPHGNVHNVHKQPIGARLALQVRRLYLKEQVVSEGPKVQNVTLQGDIVTVTFAGGSPPFYLGKTHNCTDCCGNVSVSDFDASEDGRVWVMGTHLEVTGTDKQSVSFRIEGLEPGVHPGVSLRVRYTAVNTYPQCALYNQEGLPALPFSWPKN